MSTVTDSLQQDMTRAYSKLKPITAVKVDKWWRLAKFGDKRAHENLLVICYPIALSTYKILGLPRDHMDDCISAGLLAVYTAVKSYRPDNTHQSFRSWAHRYIRTNMLRETARLTSPVSLDIYDMEEHVGRMDLLVQGWEMYTREEIADVPHAKSELEPLHEARELREAIATLPERQGILMSYVADGHNVPDACDLMGISSQAGYILYGKGINGLRKFYELL